MSDTIEVRHERARKASLFQQRPGALMDAVECRFAGSYSSKTLVGDIGVIDVGVIGVGAIGTVFTGVTGRVLLVDDDYPTGGPSVEWVSSDAKRWARWAETTKELLQQGEAAAEPAASAAAKMRVDRLTTIQAAFGLPTLAMAEILGITRQGLYKWLDASKDMTLQDASRQRLAAVERLARIWRERTNAPLSSLMHEPLADGRTALDMLTSENLDEAAVVVAFNELLGKLQGKAKSLSQKMAEGGFTQRRSGRALTDDE